jgi:hypothetical protein
MSDTNYANEYYTMTPNALAFDTKVSDKALRVWMALEDFSGGHRACWPSYAEIGRKVGCSGRWAAEMVRELEAAGWLLSELRPGKTNRYTLLGRVPRVEKPTHEVKVVAPMKSTSHKQYPTNYNQGRKASSKGLDFKKLAKWENNRQLKAEITI